MGFEAYAGFEYEVFFFNETPESVREKNYRNLKPMAPGWFGYSVIRNSVASDFYRQLLATCEAMDFGIEGLHEETGPGVIEAAITFDKALASRRQGRAVQDLHQGPRAAQPDDGDVHGEVVARLAGTERPHPPVAQVERRRSRCFTMTSAAALDERDHAALRRRPAEAHAGAAGDGRADHQLLYAPDPGLLGADRFDLRRRESHDCALRIIPGSAKSQRVEYRIAAADANPYIILSAALASGLWGIENADRARAAREGNAYDQKFPDASRCRARCGTRRNG